MLGAIFLLTILPADTVVEHTRQVDEVVVVSKAGKEQKRSAKGQVASIDEHLSELSNVHLIRRGSYAWEPVVNNMQTERVSTTIDGMKIFYACTDKMDPVTSYVESGNLQSISLNSGLSGNPQSTGNIGGSLDLKLRKAGFTDNGEPTRWEGNGSAGYETNGHLQVYGADGLVSTHRFYSNMGVFYRHADDYKAGGGHHVDFSQFQKVNAFANLGWRPAQNDIVEGTVLFDRATDVGYPALNMDVARAEGFITSLSYKHLFSHSLLSSWETKAYYNHITHVMDDTTRPDVQIHMDMPGESWTAGLYSLLSLANDRHDARLNYDLYYNRLFADMTMYPGGAAPMYMVTWPDVGTLNTGLAATDDFTVTDGQTLSVTVKWAWQQQRLNNQEGYHALKVFFPNMTDDYHQFIGRVAASYQWDIRRHTYVTVGAGWGSRAPTVTEAYGYYLNNTFDQYDYIGNPHLKNESAVELSASLRHQQRTFSVRLDANVFLFSNYIIGQFEDRLSPMTVGAEGVKVYGNLSHAHIVNTQLGGEWLPLPWLRWTANLSYALGRDDDSDPLPLISPLDYRSAIQVQKGAAQVQLAVRGNARQVDFGKKYGETETPAWAIVNLSAQYDFPHISLRGGVENLFDKQYSSYSDWNKIPQKGRNIYVSASVNL